MICDSSALVPELSCHPLKSLTIKVTAGCFSGMGPKQASPHSEWLALGSELLDKKMEINPNQWISVKVSLR